MRKTIECLCGREIYKTEESGTWVHEDDGSKFCYPRDLINDPEQNIVAEPWDELAWEKA
jgi:hypothetical protein